MPGAERAATTALGPGSTDALHLRLRSLLHRAQLTDRSGGTESVSCTRQWRESEGHGRCSQCDARGTEVKPAIIVVRIEDHAADDGAERHPKAREHRRSTEYGSHDALIKVLPSEHSVERHHPTVRSAKHDGQQIELTLLAHEQISR